MEEEEEEEEEIRGEGIDDDDKDAVNVKTRKISTIYTRSGEGRGARETER